MSAQVVTQVRTADTNSRGQDKRRNQNKKARGGNNADAGSNNRNIRNTKEKNDVGVVNLAENGDAEPATQGVVVALTEAAGDSDVCWICAEPVKYYSLSECNHRTCHVCAIRLRALYKKTDCTFCKVSRERERKRDEKCYSFMWVIEAKNLLGSTDSGYFHRFAGCAVFVL